MMTNHEEIKAVFRQVFHHDQDEDQDDSDDDAYQDVLVYLCVCADLRNVTDMADISV